MDTSKILTNKKRALTSDGRNVDVNLGPWDSVEEYETFMLDTVGFSSIPTGTRIQVYTSSDKNRVVECIYDDSRPEGEKWLTESINVVIKINGLSSESLGLLSTSLSKCDKSGVYWNTTVDKFVFKIGGKYYGTCANMYDFCDMNNKPYNNALYLCDGKLYANDNNSLAEISAGGGTSSVASQTSNGLMSYTDKMRLDTLWEKGVIVEETDGSVVVPSGGTSGSGTSGAVGGNGLTSEELAYLRSLMTGTILARVAALESALNGYTIVTQTDYNG